MQMSDKNAHIPISEIKQDILDTETGILQMMREITGFYLIGDRLSIMKAKVRESEIRMQEEFIARLHDILKLRGEQ